METRHLKTIALLALTAALVSCGRAEKPLNLIILGIDTLRPDHLGCYGYGRGTSPAIDGLAAGGALFENTVSQSSWTLPSFASLMTSLYPHQHGATHGITEIGDDFPTLATVLAGSGYATGALVNAGVLSPETRFNRGFQHYDPPGEEPRLADGTTRDALAWIDGNRDRPFFLFLHYYDPHIPYAPPAPYDTLFDEGYTGRIGRSFDVADCFPTVKGIRFEEMESASPQDWQHIEALYDGEIAFTDAAIRALLDGLAKRRLLGRTLIVLLGDHGEEFFEHKGFGHGHCLYSEVISVPLILSLPETVPEGRRISRQVRTIDIMPTVLDLLGVKTESRLEGVSLVPLLSGRGDVKAGKDCLFPPALAYTEGILHGPPQASVTAWPWKLILDVNSGREMLFDRGSDPGERTDLMGARPEAYLALSAALYAAQFGVSDTWYLEMAAGAQAHTFDVEITSEKPPMEGCIYLRKVLDAAGGLLAEQPPAAPGTSGSRFGLTDLRPGDPLILAFKVEAPPTLPLTFDLRLDGRRSPRRTFIGESLRNPEEIPFSRRTGQMSYRGLGAPRQKPEPPYFLLWRTPGRQASQKPAALSPGAKQELRALGYIQ